MNSLELFLLDHARVHAASLTNNAGGLSVAESAVRNLTDDQWRVRPHGLNSLAWIIWHIARFEDVAVNVMVAGQAQVFQEDGWADRLGVLRVDAGTEMTPPDVEDFSRTVDIPAIREYRTAVGAQTRRFVATLEPDDFDSISPAERLERVRAEGVFIPKAEWVLKIWEGKSAGWFLAWLAAGHSYMHLGQGRWVKKLILAGITS
ncbi:MAG TPA: DinB family protein [bacterium]